MFIYKGKLYKCSSPNVCPYGPYGRPPANAYEQIPFDGTILRGSIGGSIAIIDSDYHLWFNKSTGNIDPNFLLWPANTVYGNFTPFMHQIRFHNVSVDRYNMVAVDFNGNLWYYGRLTKSLNSDVLAQLTEGINFVNFSYENDVLLAIDDNGYLYGCGDNTNGIMGTRGLIKYIDEFSLIAKSRYKNVCCSRKLAICLDIEGDVWASASNASYLFGSYFEEDTFVKLFEGFRIKNVACDYYKFYLLSADGTVYEVPLNVHTSPNTFRDYKEIARNIYQISSHGLLDMEDNFTRFAKNEVGETKADTLLDQPTEIKTMSTKSARN